MNNYLLSVLFLLSGVSTFSQTNFESGYFISNSGIKTTCLIKNLDWKDNPTSFKYKLSDAAEVETATLNDVNEFAIGGGSKFIKFTVDIDRSSQILSHMTEGAELNFETETLFLKVIETGYANLYYYEDSNLTRYFYSTTDLVPVQLVYKQFKADGGRRIGEINQFKIQLLRDVSNDCVSKSKIDNCDYRLADLSKLFKDYNTCSQEGRDLENTDLQSDTKKKNQLHLSIKPGISKSSLFVKRKLRFSDRDVQLDDELSLRIGLEIEYVLPFNNNKFSVFFEPNYQYYTTEGTSNDFLYDVDYMFFEFPIGTRYSAFLNDTSNIFFNVGYSYRMDLDSEFKTRQIVNYEIPFQDVELEGTSAALLGLGYRFKKHSLEFRYYFKSELFKENEVWESEFKTASLIYGYRFL